jgi:TRAP-type C4-dicarboxylate transport system permease large subunit
VAMLDSMRISVMSFMIVATATSYSQLLAFSGTTRGLFNMVTGADVPPIVIVIGMQLIIAFLACFMEQIAIMLITLPIFMPIVSSTGLDPVWFGVLMLVNIETGLMTPPFGMLLFVMKGSAPQDTSFMQIAVAAAPFVICNILVMAILLVFPELVTNVAHLTKN